MEEMFKYFETPDVDYPAFKAMVAERFENPILVRICTAFGNNMQQIEAGGGPRLEMQAMVAKGILSLMVNLGRIGVAKEFLAGCIEKWDQKRFLEAHTMLMLPGEEIAQLDVLDKPWLDYQVIDRKAKTTMILFCGHAHRFGVELNAVALWLRSLPVNLIYLRDFNLRLYLAGLESIGNIDESITRLKKDLTALGTERIVTMGNSGGVHGALHYGYLLEADQVLCFAGPTSLKAGVEEASERPIYEIIDQMVQSGELKAPDLRECFQRSGISVRYFYGQDYEFDAAQVATLEGLPNVTIEPLSEWSRHVVIGEMARRDLLKDILAKAATG